MAVVDRLRRLQSGKDRPEDDSRQDSTGNGQTLALADNPTAARVKGVLLAMRSMIEQNAPSGNMTRMAYIILPALADEMTAEMSELDEMTVRVIMAQIGQIIAWIGHGDNSQLPDSLRTFAEGIQPSIPADNGDDPERDGRTISAISEHGGAPLGLSDESDDIVEAEIVE